jgi:hypothetical protein
MSDDALKTGIEIASTISMAIPPPAGPIVTTALQIFGMFLPGPPPSDDTKTLLEGINALPAQIGNAGVLAAAYDATSSVSTGVNRVLENWNSAKSKDYEATAINTLRGTFTDLIEVGNTFEGELAGLLKVVVTDDVAGYQGGRAAIAAYFGLLLEYIVAKKVYVELQAAAVDLIDRARKAGAEDTHEQMKAAVGQLRTDYNDLVNTVRDYTDPKGDLYPSMWGDVKEAPFTGGFVGKVRKTRGDIVTVKTEGENYQSTTYNVTVEKHFIEDPLGTPQRTNETADTFVWREHLTTFSSSREAVFTCLKPQVDAALPGAKTKVLDAFDADMADVMKGYAKLLEQVGEIGADLTPEDPTSAITVEWVDAGMEGYWVVPQGQSVAWGVQFQNGSMTSKIVWSDWYTSPGGTKVPQLSVPCDETTSALTNSRTIFRLVLPKAPGSRRSSEASQPDEAITAVLLPDNTTQTTWDFQLSKDAQLAPLPQAPAILGRGIQVVEEGTAGALRYVYRYHYLKAPGPLLGPMTLLSPPTPPLVLKNGDTLSVPGDDNWWPEMCVQVPGESLPPLAEGDWAKDVSDGQMSVWTAD